MVSRVCTSNLTSRTHHVCTAFPVSAKPQYSGLEMKGDIAAPALCSGESEPLTPQGPPGGTTTEPQGSLTETRGPSPLSPWQAPSSKQPAQISQPRHGPVSDATGAGKKIPPMSQGQHQWSPPRGSPKLQKNRVWK